MTPVAAGIVGTGFAAGAHAEALRRLPGVRVVAVAGSSAEKARAFAQRYGIERAHGDWRALIEDEGVEAVHDCTPNDLHAPVNQAALEAGRHLLSEKPLGLDGGETGALARLAERAGVVSGVCFNYRHYPLVQQARGLVAVGPRPHLVHGGYLQDWLLHREDWNWRLEPARGGASRAVADIGSHWLDLVTHVIGDRVAAVCATLGRLHEQRLRPAGEVQTFARDASAERSAVAVASEDFAGIVLRFGGGATGVLTVSQVSPGRKNRLHFEIDTGEAAYAWDQEEPNRLWIGRRDGPNQELVRDPALLDPAAAALAHLPGGHGEGWNDALMNLCADFHAAVAAQREGRPYEQTVATFADGDAAVRAVEAVLESGRDGGWVDVAGAAALA